ncbi:chondroitin sulfate proteoglycan 5 [Orycteropus afer afer]|uniref:Chondroitin sulfate proteoglycan 5 n=1 Tax=Orycteropus afer afer TaxID=1230840 RepID=A0A8B7APL6_ORYAF|nr:chondroitin sulfate proteoglycan 5 [Orycteropus afer afer]
MVLGSKNSQTSSHHRLHTLVTLERTEGETSIKGHSPGCTEEARSEAGQPRSWRYVLGGPGCGRSRLVAPAADGLHLIRLEPRPSASPPALTLPAPTPPLWGSGDLPQHLPSPELVAGAELGSGRRDRKSSVRSGYHQSFPQRGSGFRRPSLRVSGPAATPPPSSPHVGGRGPPPLLLFLGATLVFTAGAAPAREAGSTVDAQKMMNVLAWEPRANDTREGASPPATREDETAWTAPADRQEQVVAGPGVGPEEALEASAAVTGAAWLETDNPNQGGVTAEVGSGDTQALPATLPAPDQALGQSSIPPATPEASEPPSLTPVNKPSPDPELPKEKPLEVWLNLGGSTPGPHGPEPTYPFQGTLEPQPASDIIDIDYFEGLDGEGRGVDLGSFPGSLGTSEHHPDTDPGGETPSWSLLDLYDDFTPFDESDFYPTTSFYDDLDEEEEEEEDDKDAVGGGDLEDENDLLMPTKKPGLGPGPGQPTSRWHAIPPQHTLGIVPGSSIVLRPRPGEPGRDLATGENGTECRSGFVRHNGSCRSVCDLFPSYCHNGGQCYLVENIGAFCRCNTQDYIWHKGMRCESIITDFQVMCVAVGSAALVLLLLFMMTVFFAKKLYLLKTENTKLRRTNKFRTPSELHNDNFSLSTIAEGSHPNVRKFCDIPCTSSPHARALAHYDNIICQDDSSAPHKIQEVLKSCLKEEESFNIQNSMSPKLEGSKGDQADLDVNCLQNNLT